MKDNSSVLQRVFRAGDNSVVLMNLLPYTQYAVTVQAYNAAGTGPANRPPLYATTAESCMVCFLFVVTTSESTPASPTNNAKC